MRPTFLVIFTMLPLKIVRGSSMVVVEEMITDSQHWTNVRIHVVSTITLVTL